MKRTLFVLVLLLVWIAPVSAQTIASYTLRTFDVGAPMPRQTQPIQAPSVTCNLAPTSGGSTINPTHLEWNDTINAGRVCRVDQSTVLLALPVPGSYEGTLSATDDAGLESAESNRAPFGRRAVPAAPTGFRLVR